MGTISRHSLPEDCVTLIICALGTVIFTRQPVYHWYLSVTAIFLNTSWSLHNVIAWMKNKPFLSRKASLFYIITVALVQPYWVVEIVANVSTTLKACELVY